MKNVIAVIWDCDKTLIDGYMQDPMFAEYGVETKQFWADENEILDEYQKTGVRVNRDTYYLNYFIKCAHEGIFPGLNNAKLRSFGKLQKLYPGTLEFFRKTKNMFRNDASYSEYDIQVEHYIVSTGFAEVIRGMELMNYVDDVWGCELMEAPDADNQPLSTKSFIRSIIRRKRVRFLKSIKESERLTASMSIPRFPRSCGV